MRCHPTCRECALLKDNATKGKHLPTRNHNMCTRASTLHASRATHAQSLPANIRHIQWNELQASCSGSMVLVGKGTLHENGCHESMHKDTSFWREVQSLVLC